MSPTTTSLPKPDLDPRVERSRQQVLAATIELLGEAGYGPLSVEAVAARSGVAKSTIYRHWAGKDELVSDAIALLGQEDPFEDALPPPGPVESRVTALLTTIATVVQDPTWNPANCLGAVIESADRCPELALEAARMFEERTGPLYTVLQEAVTNGELPQDTDVKLLADALVGPIILRRLFHREPITASCVPGLVRQVLPDIH